MEYGNPEYGNSGIIVFNMHPIIKVLYEGIFGREESKEPLLDEITLEWDQIRYTKSYVHVFTTDDMDLFLRYYLYLIGQCLTTNDRSFEGTRDIIEYLKIVRKPPNLTIPFKKMDQPLFDLMAELSQNFRIHHEVRLLNLKCYATHLLRDDMKGMHELKTLWEEAKYYKFIVKTAEEKTSY